MKITKGLCSLIRECENDIIIGGNQIILFDKKTLSKKTSFIVKNVSGADMDDKYIYSKDTSGVYRVFDYKTNQKICTSKYRKLDDTSFDNGFYILQCQHQIIDVLKFRNSFYYLVKFSPESNNYEEFQLLKYPDAVLKQMVYDDVTQTMYILFNETCCLNKESTISHLKIVDIKSMKEIADLSRKYPHGIWPIFAFQNNKLLSNDMIIWDYKNNTSEKVNGLSNGLFAENGYLHEVVQQENLLIFICSKKVFVYDLLQKRVTHIFDNKDCSTARIIDGKMFLGTWQGVYVYEME